jgi:MFS superfamily sulfate permease-like transporter
MVLALGTLAATFLLPKKFPKVPAALVAVTVAAGLNTLLGLGAPVIGALSCSFPSPAFPEAIDYETMYSLVGSSLALYGLTSLESLLSGSAADKIDREDPRKHNPNVDLVGQGLANVAVSCFGGIPVTGAIARTSLNITAGAKTRRAAIFHVGVLGGVFALGPVISLVPLSALSGILLSVALRLLSPKELKFLSKVSYREVVPLAATFGTVLMSDLVTGVQVGTVTAVAMQFTKHVPRFLSYTLAGDDDENLTTVRLAGDITFISASKISALRVELVAMSVSEEAPVVLDFSDIRSVDASASEMIVDIVYDMEELGHTPSTFKILGLSHEQERVLLVCDSRGLIEKFIHKIPHNVSKKSF